MKITEVALENIKSYEGRTVVPIEGGVTAILGENGAGKSTIQEAIGFALFDSLPFNNKEFVREGASSGTVEVSFEQQTSKGRQLFRVTRSARRSRYGVHRYNFETDEWIDQDIDSHSQLIKWLCARFDVEDKYELQSLWQSCIGVAQTRFLSDFADNPDPRKKKFDALLNLDAYEESWNRLKDIPDAIEREEQKLREEIVGLTSTVQGLPDERTKAESLSNEVESIEAVIGRKTDELTEKEAEHEEFEAVQDELDSLEQEVGSLEQDIEATKGELKTAKGELRAANEAQKKCEENHEEHRQHKEASEKLDELEKREKEQDKLTDRKTEQEKEISAIKFEVEQLEEDLETLQSARETLETREDDKERYEELDEKINSLQQRESEIEELQDEIESLTEEIGDKEEDVESKEATVVEIENEWEKTTHPEELDEKINSQQARRQQLKNEREHLEEQLERLHDTNADAPCPTCDRPLNEKHRSDSIEQREERLEEIETERERLGEELSELRDQRKNAQEVRRRADKLPIHREKIEELETELDSLQAEKSEAEETLEKLKEKLTELPEFEAEQEELQEAYDEYQTAKFRVSEHSDVPDKLEQKRTELEAADSKLEKIEDELEEFEGLDEKLAEVKETLDETEAAYQTYLKHEQQASQVEERQQVVNETQEELAELEEDLDETKAEFEETRASFDKEQLKTLESDIEKLKGEIQRKKGSLEEKKNNLRETREEIERLEETLEERQQKLQQLKELKADHQFAGWVRENVREAGPKMREIITDRIGARANELFRTIRGASAETLEWTSDYEIVVHDADITKSFSTLSGGEKMAAALSVRLAILEQLASVGVAFLDEPTANLDREKKRNLVSQLKQLDSFEQLTVISHDETFDSMTDYTISVTKDRQTSEVKVN